jgi:hypothetical protein
MPTPRTGLTTRAIHSSAADRGALPDVIATVLSGLADDASA